jgi:hypothetical protein
MRRENRYLLENTCHSLNRFDCYNTDKTNLLTLRKKTSELHLFYNSVSCAKQVLSSITIKVSFFMVSLISAVILG